ncbi:MAG TPA: EamA family transporter [Phycisphaerae bacterium]|nr:EamA family transporter [Phycisphaerae bacterium]
MKWWWVYALLGAFFGGIMPLCVKRGLKLDDGTDIDSNLATAVRVVMLLLPVWLLVWYQGTAGQMPRFSKVNWLFLGLSAVATGLSWLFSFKALQYADASRVMPIDKFSLVISVGGGMLFLGEAFSWRLVMAVALIMAGTFLTIQPGKGAATGANAGDGEKTHVQGRQRP